MAASTRRDLFLQVSASTDNMQTALKAGKSVLAQFGTSATDTIGEINKAFANLGGGNVEETTRSITAAYSKTFTAIRANAQNVLGANSGADALSIVNVNGARQAAEQATAQAAALRLVADAAAQAALANTENATAAKAYATAAAAAALGAEEQALALKTQADVLSGVAAQTGIAADANVELAHSHGSVGASGLIVDHVIRSMSDSIAAGRSPVQALTMEMGRIGEAMQLVAMTSGSTGGAMGKFAGFMSGPFAIAVVAATAVLTPLVAKLFETTTVLDLAKVGANNLGEAQGVLGGLFDETTGKIKSQNEMLRLNAQLTAINLRAQAQDEMAKAKTALGKGGDRTVGAALLDSMALLGQSGQFGTVYVDPANTQTHPNVRSVGDLAKRLLGGTITSSDALAQTEKMDFSGSAITKAQLQEAIIQMGDAPDKTHMADLIDQSLKTGTLPKELLKPSRKVDHTVERNANNDRAYQNQLRSADDAIAKARLQLAGGAQEQYQIELDQIASDLAQKNLAVQDEVTAKKLSQAEADILKGKNDDKATLDRQLALRKKQLADLDIDVAMDINARDAAAALLEIDAQFATTRKKRLAIEQQRLDLEEANRLEDIGKKLAKTTDPGEQKQLTDQANQTVDQYDAARKLLNYQNGPPLQQYSEQIKRNVGDMNDALQGVAVDGLKGLEDGLTGLISGTESVSQAFKKMAQSIIADLVRIAIEKEIIGPLTKLLGFSDGDVPGHADGMIPGFADGIISGKGTGRSDSILATLDGKSLIRVSNGESIINAESTRRYRPLLKAINDRTIPGFADGGIDLGSIAMPSLSNADMRALSPSRGRSGSINVSVDARGATDPAMVEAAAYRAVANAAPALIAASKAATINAIGRPALPGGLG